MDENTSSEDETDFENSSNIKQCANKKIIVLSDITLAGPFVRTNHCNAWNKHSRKYKRAREEYQKDAKDQNVNKVTITVDLQKVVMLPRYDTFNDVIFVPRFLDFNETVMPFGTANILNSTAVVWHEALIGRKKKNIIDTFYAFFLTIRDIENVTLWLDNCSTQNKNWTLYCYLKLKLF
ncbi:unnamed protein product [Psylliodes chrysocephalus]|uniref:Uncharacterized protein n=1 Tax=Psylliodes chrysocephalus TaxID=3402493 RepID=A0A9P0G5Q2_9CUCU|nr:unnamed protein product [Psylliodes chrysocephala]